MQLRADTHTHNCGHTHTEEDTYESCMNIPMSVHTYTLRLRLISPVKVVKHLQGLFVTFPNLPKCAGDGTRQHTAPFPVLNTYVCITMWIGGPFPTPTPLLKPVASFCLHFILPITQYPPFLSAWIRCLYCRLIDADQHYVRYHSPTLRIRIHRISQE